MSQPIAESTVARIAGNLLSVAVTQDWFTDDDGKDIEWAVRTARAIVAEVERTQLAPDGELKRT